MEIFSGNKRKVIVSREDAREFMSRFPCSGLDSTRHYWFEFDERGDLVDTDVPEHSDGPGALALSQDAQAFLDEQGE